MGIAADVLIFKHIMPQRITVLFAEPVAPGISIATELRWPTLRIDQSFIRANAEVTTSDRCLCVRHLRQNLTVGSVARMMTSTGTVNPVVQTPAKPVDSQLLIAFQKSREQRLANIGLAITIRVFCVDNLRSRCDQHSPAPRHNTVWKWDIL